MYLSTHPLCSCGARATEVDHIDSLRSGGTHADSNLRAMCKPCHSSRTAREQGIGGPKNYHRVSA